MKAIKIVEPLRAKVVVEGSLAEVEVTGGYCGDLLSDCIAHATEGSVWITIQSHPNTIAVAVLVGMACIVVTNDQDISKQTIERALKENITLLSTPLTSYQAVSALSKLGVPGTRKHG